MRLIPLALGMLLATAAVALAPDADARSECVDVKDHAHVCVPDGCTFRSDCCDGVTSFWCPEDE